MSRSSSDLKSRDCQHSDSPLPLAILLLTMAGVLAQAMPAAPGVVIIANPDVKAREISADDLRAVFLGTKTSLGDDSSLKPVLEKSGPAHAAFLKEYLGKTDFALQTYYRSLVFSGKGSMPTILRSDAEVVAYVEKTRGAIGYVASPPAEVRVKTLRVK